MGFGLLMIGGELLATGVPARGKTSFAHLTLAQVMAAGMLGLGVIFAFALTGVAAVLAAMMTAAMAVAGLLTFADKRRYAAYELAFILSSYLSVVVAAFALK